MGADRELLRNPDNVSVDMQSQIHVGEFSDNIQAPTRPGRPATFDVTRQRGRTEREATVRGLATPAASPGQVRSTELALTLTINEAHGGVELGRHNEPVEVC